MDHNPVFINVVACCDLFHCHHDVFEITTAPVVVDCSREIEPVRTRPAGVWCHDHIASAGRHLVNWVESVEERAVGTPVDIQQQGILFVRVEIRREPDPCFDLEAVSFK